MKKRILSIIICSVLAVATLPLGAHAAGAVLDTYGTMSEGNNWHEYSITLNQAANIQPFVSANAGMTGDPFLIEWIISVESPDGQGFTLFSPDIEYEMHQGQISWHIGAQYLSAGDYTVTVSAPEYLFADNDAYGEPESNGYSYEWSLSLETDAPAVAPAQSAPLTPPSGVDAPDTWAAAEVNEAITLGIVPPGLQSGYSAATTRAEFCAVAVALYEKLNGTIEDRAYFTDTDDVNVQKMASLGVVNGTNAELGLFEPNRSINREEAATLLARLSYALDAPMIGESAYYEDYDDISPWALSAVARCQDAGVMQGVAPGIFQPKGGYQRQQSIIAALRLYHFADRYTAPNPDYPIQ